MFCKNLICKNYCILDLFFFIQLFVSFMNCSILTPYKVAFEGEIDTISIKKDGDCFDILDGHMNDIKDIGFSTLELFNKKECVLKINVKSFGILSIKDNNLNVNIFDYEQI